MSVDVQSCRACAVTWFPRRLLCPSCGDGGLSSVPVDTGVLEESTTLRDGVEIGTLLVSGGARLIARLHGSTSRGDTIALSHDPDDVRRPVAYVPDPSQQERNTDG